MIYRKADRADLDAVEKLYDHAHDAEEAGLISTGWLRDVYPVRATAEAALDRDDLYVCESEDGTVVATAIINKIQVDVYYGADWKYDATDEEVCVLHTLLVDPDTHKAGVGSGFVRFYEQTAREWGCPVLRMDTNAINKTARKMYAGLGYREADIVPTVFNGIPGINLVLLEKNLK